MRLLFTADLHGLDSAYQRFAEILATREFDVGVFAGDLMGFPSEAEIRIAGNILKADGKLSAFNDDSSVTDHITELALRNKEKYYKSLLAKTKKPVVFVMGNDDGILGKGLAWKSEGRIVDIDQRSARYDRYNFVGYPYTTPFVGGAFERTLSQQKQDLTELKRLVDRNTILVTHGPPLYILDVGSDGQHYGNKLLRDLVHSASPRLHLFGHIHSSHGRSENFINGAYPYSRKFFSIEVDTLQVEMIG